MRLRSHPVLVPAVLVPTVVCLPVPVHALTVQAPSACAPAHNRGFPVDARLRDGPGTYRAGDGFRDWTIELANGGRAVCRNIHPVLVLVDSKRVLRARQVRLEFNDGTRWRSVRLEHTDRNENIGVFDGFPGFTVRPGRTVTVKVRLALESGTAPNAVVAQAAVVRRDGEDGTWVGESDGYAFDIVSGGRNSGDTGRASGGRNTSGGRTTAPGHAPATGSAKGYGATEEATERGGRTTGAGNGRREEHGRSVDTGTGTSAGTATGTPDGLVTDAPRDSGRPGTDTGTARATGNGTGTEAADGTGRRDRVPGPLADTGPVRLRRLAVTACALVLVGGVLRVVTGRPGVSRR